MNDTPQLPPDHLWQRCAVARDIARRAGRKAAAFLHENHGEEGLGLQRKGPQDFVTAADKATEEMIRSELALAYPQDAFLGEESGGGAGAGGTWVVDPIDGTANYMRGLPQWAVSIAYVSENHIQAGVIYDPSQDKTYWAVRGGGAHLDHVRLPTPRQTPVSDAIMMLGTSGKAPHGIYIDVIEALRERGAEHRRHGSAALGLALSAEGAVDGYFEASLNSWDALAGLLIALEAGLTVLAPPLSDFLKAPGPVLVGIPALTRLTAESIGPLAARLAPAA